MMYKSYVSNMMCVNTYISVYIYIRYMQYICVYACMCIDMHRYAYSVPICIHTYICVYM